MTKELNLRKEGWDHGSLGQPIRLVDRSDGFARWSITYENLDTLF